LEGAAMANCPDRNQNNWEEKLIKEIKSAQKELYDAQLAFEWAENDPKAIDAAISRMQAANNYYDFLLKQAKKLNISAHKKHT
jgi:hypothetical protein